MSDLSEVSQQLIDALLHAATAWQTPAQLACALGWTLDTTSDALASLDEAGWLESWDCEPSPVVTLSPLAAARLGVRLVEAGLRGELRWLAQGEPEPRPARTRLSYSQGQALSLEAVADPHLPPDLEAEHAEEQARKALRRRIRAGPGDDAEEDDPPWPTLLLGLSLSPWPGPRSQPVEKWICPVCGTRRLEPNMYCLLCDRWGLDGSVRSARPPRPPRSEASAGRLEERKNRREAREVERARAFRKARRRARFAAETEKREPPKCRNGSPETNGRSEERPPDGSG